jgi:hypothetical protein
MTIWGAMLIPFLMIAVLMIFFRHRTKWWEVAIPLLVSVLMVGGSKWMAENYGTKDMEIWNGWTVQARYYEEWDEYIHQTCTMCTGYDKDGFCNSEITYDCSYVSNHSPHWEITDSNGAGHGVSQESYQYFVKLFGHTPIFKDMQRNYHSVDGDRYHVNWPKTDATVEPVNVTYAYENRVQASRSVFNYAQISDSKAQELKLFTYPEVKLFGYPSVLGDCGAQTATANERLRFHNSMLGSKKQLRMWILCTDSPDPQTGQLQEAYWVGGNKNEVVAVLGQGWVHVFSWTDNKTPIIETRDFLKSQGREGLLQSVDFMSEKLDQQFQRKHFAEFSYLTIEPPTWAIVVTYVVTLLVNCGLSYFIIVNEWDDDKGRSYRGRSNWRY